MCVLVNCKGTTYGDFFTTYPSIRPTYLEQCKEGVANLLGKIRLITDKELPYQVICLYAQVKPVLSQIENPYNALALRSCLEELKTMALNAGWTSIGIPDSILQLATTVFNETHINVVACYS